MNVEWLGTFIPWGDEPEIFGSGADPDESDWREGQQRWAAEEELRESVRALLERFFDEPEWEVECPDGRVLSLASERLEWAAGFCRALSRLPCASQGPEGLGPVGDRDANEVQRWLVIDCYEADFAFPKRWGEKRDRW